VTGKPFENDHLEHQGDGTGLQSCTVVAFNISGVEPSGSTTTKLDWTACRRKLLPSRWRQQGPPKC